MIFLELSPFPVFFDTMLNLIRRNIVSVSSAILGSRAHSWALSETNGSAHKILTYVEYRAVSCVFQDISPHPPLHPASVSSPRTKGGGYTLAGRAVRGVGGQYFGRRQT